MHCLRAPSTRRHLIKRDWNETPRRGRCGRRSICVTITQAFRLDSCRSTGQVHGQDRRRCQLSKLSKHRLMSRPPAHCHAMLASTSSLAPPHRQSSVDLAWTVHRSCPHGHSECRECGMDTKPQSPFSTKPTVQHDNTLLYKNALIGIMVPSAILSPQTHPRQSVSVSERERPFALVARHVRPGTHATPSDLSCSVRCLVYRPPLIMRKCAQRTLHLISHTQSSRFPTCYKLSHHDFRGLLPNLYRQ